MVVGSAIGTVTLAQMAESHVRSAPAFSLSDIEVEGNDRLERDDILEHAGLTVGGNVFEVAPEDAQARLLAHPWVAEATVTRQLPSSFQIHVREHRAVALLSLDGLYLVSDDGSVFKRLDESDVVDLPVVSGVDRTRFVRDLQYRSATLTRVVALMHDYRGAGLWRREPISEIHVEANDGLSLYIGEDNVRVRLGGGPYRAKLLRLRRVLERLKRQQARAEYVHLDNVRRPDRVTVRIR